MAETAECASHPHHQPDRLHRQPLFFSVRGHSLDENLRLYLSHYTHNPFANNCISVVIILFAESFLNSDPGFSFVCLRMRSA